MSYLQHFGLKHDPLGKLNTPYIETEQAGTLKSRLDWLAQTKGVGLITGEPGVGKTAALRAWTTTLNPLTTRVLYQSDNHFQPFDIYCQLAEMLGLPSTHRYCRLWRAIKTEILSLFDDKKITPIWILDEAQHLSPQFLAQLPAFLNLNFDTRDVMVIILMGTPALQAITQRTMYAALASRLQFQFHWQAIEQLDCFSKFISSAFHQAGCHETLLSQSAMNLLQMASKGRLRNAHRLLTRCLQLATEKNMRHLPDDIVEIAIEQCRLAIR